MSDNPMVLYEWSFAGYFVRIEETDPGVVRFVQGKSDPDGHPSIMKFEPVDRPMGAANEIINLSMSLAEREATIRERDAEIERLREAVRVLAWTRCEDCGGTGTVWGGPIEDPQECQCQRCCAEGIVPPTNEDRRIEQLLGEDFVLRALSANDRGESREEEGE